MKGSAENIIPIHSAETPVIRNAVVTAIGSDEILIRISGNQKRAKKAFSCLVDPEYGDRVICTTDEDGVYYILCIVERPQSKNMDLSFPGQNYIGVNEGGLHIQSPNTITTACKDLNFFSGKSIFTSREATFSCEEITAAGNSLQAKFQTVRLVSNLINTMARQAIDKFKGYIRNTEESDMVKAGRLTRDTNGLYAVNSEHTIMNSKQSTKIDGEKILMG